MRRLVLTLLVLMLQFIGQGCGSERGQAQPNPQTSPAVDDQIKKIVEGVGKVHSTFTQGAKGRVFVFEEFHTSRIGQLEIAVMLLRLREQLGVTTVGLEGAIQAKNALNAAWFHRSAGATQQGSRQDVAVRMLAEGEISSAEFMTLVFPDEQVFGIEDALLYNRKHDLGRDAATGYLVSIAENRAPKNLSQSDIRKLNDLIEKGKNDEAIEMLLNSDPWTKTQYAVLKQAAAENAPATSCEAMEARMRAIRSKADELGVAVESEIKKAAVETIAFFQSCQQRTVVMVDRAVALPRAKPGAAIAIVVGAAHTQGTTKLLTERDVSFVVITPNGLNPNKGSLTGDQFERKNKTKWARTNPGTLGRLLNAPGSTQGAQAQRKPPPMIETTTAKSYASAQLAGMLIGMAARDRKRVPEDVWGQIKDLPEYVPNRNSFAIVDGDDVVYSSTLKKTDGTTILVWARVGTGATSEATRDLEQQLLQARIDLGGGGRLPPTKPPSKSTPTNDEGPGDGKRGDVVISRIGPKSLAVFGASKADVMKVGRVSG